MPHEFNGNGKLLLKSYIIIENYCSHRPFDVPIGRSEFIQLLVSFVKLLKNVIRVTHRIFLRVERTRVKPLFSSFQK